MMQQAYTVVYEDDDLIVVDKSAGVLSIPDRYVADKPNIQAMLQQRYDRIWTVHRLDRDTSGLVIFAKTEEAHRHLSLQFENRTVTKLYYALAQGRMAESSGTIDYAISPNKNRPGQMMVSNKGREALTTWRVLESFKNYTLAEVETHTGRTHQIRVHFMAIGHPLAGDPLYNKEGSVFLSRIKGRKKYHLGREKEERPLLDRTGLHAYGLSIDHPTTAARMTWQCDPPKDLRALLKQLGKWDS